MKQNILYLTLLHIIVGFVDAKSQTLYKTCLADDKQNDYEVTFIGAPVPPDWNIEISYGSASVITDFIDTFNVVESIKFNDWGDDVPIAYLLDCPSGFNGQNEITDDLSSYCYKKFVDEERNNELNLVYKKKNKDDQCINGFENYVDGEKEEKEEEEEEETEGTEVIDVSEDEEVIDLSDQDIGKDIDDSDDDIEEVVVDSDEDIEEVVEDSDEDVEVEADK